MPVISKFYGIIVMMYFFDRKKHKKPHIHVKYQDYESVIGLPDGKILEGSLPSPKLKLVLAWIVIHKKELIDDWNLASNGKAVFKIEPLR